MPYMEGIGDEVLITVAVVVIIIASLVLWSLTETSTSSPLTPQHTVVQNSTSEPRTTPRRDPDTDTSPQERPPDELVTESQSHADPQVEGTRAHLENLTVHDHVPNQNSEPDCDDNENVDIRQRRLEFFNKNSTESTDGRSASDAETVVNGPLVNTAVNSPPTEEDANSSAELEVHIRLKYLDDTERLVQTRLSQNIQQFKRIHFADELANNRLVRLISTGYVLEDSRTLQSYGLMDNSVIHVQIQTNQVNNRRASHDAESELDIGQFLSPILGVTLLCVWIMHFQYKEYFSTTSTVALLVLSVLFLTVVWGQHGGSRTLNTPVQ